MSEQNKYCIGCDKTTDEIKKLDPQYEEYPDFPEAVSCNNGDWYHSWDCFRDCH